MAIDREKLIELYKITLEELRHQETIYVHAFIGLGILIPVFLTGVSFLFGGESPLRQEYVCWVKWIVFLLALGLGAFFLVVILRINGRFKVCREVAKRIETILIPVVDSKEVQEVDKVLIRRELDKGKFDNWFSRIRLFIYVAIGLLGLAGVGFFIFMFIE